MSNSLEPRRAPTVFGEPAPLSANFAGALSAAANAVADGAIAAEAAPPHLRQMLTRRREVVAAALEAAPRDKILAVLASLDGMVTRAETDAAEARFAIRRDLEDLTGLPLWALEAAAAAFRRGAVGEGKFRPTAGELRREALRRMRAHAEELAKLERVLTARVEPPRREADPQRRRALADALRAAAAGAALSPPAPAGDPS